MAKNSPRITFCPIYLIILLYYYYILYIVTDRGQTHRVKTARSFYLKMLGTFLGKDRAIHYFTANFSHISLP